MRGHPYCLRLSLIYTQFPLNSIHNEASRLHRPRLFAMAGWQFDIQGLVWLLDVHLILSVDWARGCDSQLKGKRQIKSSLEDEISSDWWG
jgi:hypothetical protein